MVSIIMQQQQQQTSGMVSTHPSNPPSSSSSLRSHATASVQSQLPSPLSLGQAATATAGVAPALQRQTPAAVAPEHVVGTVIPLSAAHPSGEPALTLLSRIRFSDIIPYDGAPLGPYIRAVEALSGSLMKHNAAVIELGSEDAALMRCGLESARLYFRTRAAQSAGSGGGSLGKGSRGIYMYRAGRYGLNN